MTLILQEKEKMVVKDDQADQKVLKIKGAVDKFGL
tara:strand:+ start:710 stop:814 length:105 start_codon:yes stop_codon:yes gene_type:complete